MADFPKMYRMNGGKLEEVDTSLKRICEIAKSRLDDSHVVLRIIYVDNKDAPPASS
jgi:hypothetical protein